MATQNIFAADFTAEIYDSYILELGIICNTSSNCLWNTRLDYILFYSGKIPCGVKDHFLHFFKLPWEHQAGLYFKQLRSF